jgi:hypothetical protein
MRLLRRILVSIAIAAFVAGTMPLALALDCIPQAAPAEAPCEHAGCDGPDDRGTGCVCIHYPAPHAPSSLAVFDALSGSTVRAEMRAVAVTPPETVAARSDPPDPPPPRSNPRFA